MKADQESDDMGTDQGMMSPRFVPASPATEAMGWKVVTQNDRTLQKAFESLQRSGLKSRQALEALVQLESDGILLREKD